MSPIQTDSLTLPQLFRYIAAFVVVIVLVGYALYQARNLISGPRVELTNEPAMVQYEETVLIEGRARNITEITLNGRQLFIDEQGYFSHPLVLENGYTIMTITAHDRYGRATTLSREFVLKE